MRVFIAELKKIFSLKTFIPALIILLLVTVFVYSENPLTLTHTENYPEELPPVMGRYSVDLLFYDMLLEKYGKTIDADEIEEVIHLRNDFAEQVSEAVKKDRVLQKERYYLDEDFNLAQGEAYDDFVYDTEQEFFTPVVHYTDEEYQYLLGCISLGTTRLKETDYPLYFLEGFSSVISDFEKMSKEIEGYEYPVMPSRNLVFGISSTFFTIIGAFIAATVIMIPYAVKEKKSNIDILTFASKTGRKTCLRKIGAAGLFSVFAVFVGAVISFLNFSAWDVDRYYASSIDMVMFHKAEIEQINHAGLFTYGEFLEKCYNGMNYLEFYIAMAVLLALCCICMLIIITVISYNFGNTVSAFAASVPFIGVVILFYLRYIEDASILITKYEPIIALAALYLILLAAVVIAVFANKKKSL